MMIVASTIDNKKKLISEKKFTDRHSCYAVIFKDKKLLLVNTRSSGKYWFSGGKVESGEDDFVGLKREVKEEVNIDIEVKEKLVDVKSYFYYEPEDSAWSQISSFYICNALTSDLRDDKNPEHGDESFKPEWKNIQNLEYEDFQDYGYEIIRLLKEKKYV